MYRTHYVLAMLSLYAGMAHSFSWEIVTTVSFSSRLDFYDIDGTLTHTENITSPSGTIDNMIYDPVHDRVLFADSNSIYSFEIATKKSECLITDSYEYPPGITDLAYDPATELLFWTENYNQLYSISIKPGLNKTEKQLIPMDNVWIVEMAVDSCEGFIYYYYLADDSTVKPYEKVRFDGSERQVVIDNVVSIFFDNDQKSHKLYWNDIGEPRYYNDVTDTYACDFKYSDLNGQNITTIHKLTPERFFYSLTPSRDFIYLRINDKAYGNGTIWKIPKELPHDFDIESQLFIEYDQHISGIATKYSIEDIIRGRQNCDALTSLLPNNSVSTDVSVLCVHGTKVSGESRCECAQGYSGERCEVAVCHNYCLHGDCSASAEGQPKCRCNAGYSGERCEVNACQAYCLNDGVCSLSADSKPVCQCTGDHEGDRCEVPVFAMKCVQTVSMLRDLLNTDVTSVKGVKSTCASTLATVV